MKRMLAILCVCALLMGLRPGGAAAETPDWADAYRELLKTYEAATGGLADYSGLPACEYTLYDIDKDGVPELIVKTGTCEADYTGTIYRYADGRVGTIGEEIHLGHAALYSDPGEYGIIVVYGHMGEVAAVRISFTDGWSEETLYTDDLNARRQNDPNADYIYPGDVVPGAAMLTLSDRAQTLPLRRYEEIASCMEGVFPATTEGYWPSHYGAFFTDVINGNGTVTAVAVDPWSNSPGEIGFQDLLRQNVAVHYMQQDAAVGTVTEADLNGDGKFECLVELTQGEASPIHCVLSEQEGVTYAYLLNYMDALSVDENGCLVEQSRWWERPFRYRLIFDGPEAFLLSLPTE